MLRHGAWIFGILLLGALIAAALKLGEIGQFIALAQGAEPQWLLLAAAAQLATYACAAGTWVLALRRSRRQVALAALIPLSIAKLFTDQAVPTGGISGAMLVIEGLKRRGIPAAEAMATMLVSLVSYYAAYLLAAALSLAILWLHHHASAALWIATAALAVVSVAVPALVFWLRRRGVSLVKRWRRLSPALAELLAEAAAARQDLLRMPGLLAAATALQFAVFALDALTLWIAFAALGRPVEPWIAFVALVTASLAATLGPVPLGLGTFEAAAVAMLTVLGVEIEAALAATLLLRGMTFWLPMLPGLLLARREIRGSPA